MENKTYRYFKGTPLYPFGYGLSYTEFEYSNLAISENKLKTSESKTVKISIDVKNIGEFDSDEVIQIYVSAKNASVITPLYDIRGFERIHLKSGEVKTIDFELPAKSFSIINEKGEKILEPCTFDLFAGGSLPDFRSKTLTGKVPLKNRNTNYRKSKKNRILT